MIETTEVEAPTEVNVSETKAPEMSTPEEQIRPETSAPEKVRAPEQKASPEIREAPTLEAPETIEAPAVILTPEDEILEEIAVSEVPSLETLDMMTPPNVPKMLSVLETAAVQKICTPDTKKEQKVSSLAVSSSEVSSSNITIPEVKEAPENMVTFSELTTLLQLDTLVVSSPGVSVPEIEAPVMEAPILEIPGVITPKMEGAPEVMETQEVTAILETLVSPELITPPQISLPEVVAAPQLTEPTTFTAGLEKIEAPDILPRNLAEGPEWSAPEMMEAPEDVNIISNKELETSEGTKVPDVMECQKLSCSELKTLGHDDLNVTEPEIMARLEDVSEPEVILAPEMEAQEMTADVPAVLCEIPVKVPSEEPAVQENNISAADTQIKVPF